MRQKAASNTSNETILENPIIQEAAKIMARSKVGFLIVEDIDENIIIGTITEHDIVVEVISKDPEAQKMADSTINSQDYLADIVQKIGENNSLNKSEQCIHDSPIVHDKDGNSTLH